MMINEKNCGCTHDIDCAATKCVYNTENKCTASRIHVGTHDACTSSETCCDTFVEK